MVTGGGIDRLRGVLFPRPSALRRRSDRIETAVHRLAVLVLVLMVPVVVVLGQAGARHAADVAATVRATAHPVVATAGTAPPPVADPAMAYGGALLAVPVTWVGDDLRVHSATMPLGPAVDAGRQVPLWVDADDRPVDPPASAGDATAEGVIDGVAVLVATLAVLVGLLVGVRTALDRGRLRKWDADWWAFVHRRRDGTRPGDW
ncbi:hypothetical protein [Actinomycetospora atypica]|uniref:Transmembrane protein n=1 Tax=Actinomycetospora atypica TaxID=1290095 RepID=A0ABV9YJ73_9PSEU